MKVMAGPLLYVVGTVLTLSLTSNLWMKFVSIPTRDSEIETLKYDKVVLENAIIHQNKEVEENRLDKERASRELSKWKNKPAKVKWKDRTKVLYKDVNTTKGKLSCEDKEQIEANVYSRDWNNFDGVQY